MAEAARGTADQGDFAGEAAGGRKISARHVLEVPPAETADMVRVNWPLRAVDYDVMNHVNNAAYWSAVEEVLARSPGRDPRPRTDQPVRAILEYGSGIEVGSPVELLVRRDGDKQVDVWFTIDGAVHATARVAKF